MAPSEFFSGLLGQEAFPEVRRQHGAEPRGLGEDPLSKDGDATVAEIAKHGRNDAQPSAQKSPHAAESDQEVNDGG